MGVHAPAARQVDPAPPHDDPRYSPKPTPERTLRAAPGERAPTATHNYLD